MKGNIEQKALGVTIDNKLLFKGDITELRLIKKVKK